MQENLIQPGNPINVVPCLDSHHTPAPRAWLDKGPNKVERRRTRRYEVNGRLLSVCEYYAGQILDISRTGLAFQIVHFLAESGDKGGHHPLPSDTLDILSPGLSGYYFRDLRVETICDLNLGPLYPKNNAIIAYRRCVRLAEPLHDNQFLSLQRYLRGKVHEAASANYFS